MSNQPRTIEIHRHEDDNVVGYKVQFLFSQVLPVFQSLYLLHVATEDTVLRAANLPFFRARGVLHDDNVCDISQATAQAIAKRFIKPPYSRVRAALNDYECCSLPTTTAFSAKKREIKLQSVLIKTHKFIKSARNSEKRNIERPRPILEKSPALMLPVRRFFLSS